MGIARSTASLLLGLVFSFLIQSPTFAAKKSYVVYLGGHSHHGKEVSLHVSKRVRDSHHELLASVLGNKEKAHDALFYSYTRYINGFAANLEEEEAMKISKYPGVISVFPNRGYKLHTTRSWEFLGLERDGRVPKESLWTKARFGEDIIIGNLDTGVWPESESFKDDGFGPLPSRWKGICQIGVDKSFSCNRSNPSPVYNRCTRTCVSRYLSSGAYLSKKVSSREIIARTRSKWTRANLETYTRWMMHNRELVKYKGTVAYYPQ